MSVENEVEFSSSRLDENQLLGTLAVVKTDLSCLLLGTLRTDELVSEREAHHTLMLEANGNDAHPMTASAMGAYLARMPEDYVITTYSASGERSFVRTDQGEIATGLGGNMLSLSKASNVATRTLLGEHRIGMQLKNGVVKSDSLQARIIVLSYLFTSAQARWQRSGELYKQCEEHGLNKRTSYVHVVNLANAGLLELRSRPNPKGGVLHEHRIRSKKGKDDTTVFYEPARLIGEFLQGLGKFACLDDDFISYGKQETEETVHDKRWVPSLIKRTLVNGSYLGKTTSLAYRDRDQQ